jgi:hypothetical protein
MGQGREFVRKTTEDAMRALMRGYIERSAAVGRPDVVGRTSPDGNYVYTETGEIRELISDGTPKEYDTTIVIDDKYAYKPNPIRKHIQIDSTKSGFLLVGAYPSEPGSATSSATSFPEFNIYNLKTGQRYRIPKEHASLLTNIYLVDIATSDTNGMNGFWKCKLSPNRDKIVILRYKRNHISGAEVGGGVFGIKAYWAVISGFTLDATNSLVDLSSATVSGGTQAIAYGGPTLPARDHETYTMNAKGVISFDADGDPHLDLFGSTNAQGFDDGMGGPINEIEENGYWRTENLQSGSTTTFTNDGQRFAGSDDFFMKHGLHTADDTRNNGIVAVRMANEDTANLAYNWVGGSGSVPQVYYQSPFGVHQNNSASFTDYFMVDGLRNYAEPAAWTGTYSVKVVDDERFLRLTSTTVTGGKRYTIANWSYSTTPSPTFTVGKSFVSKVLANVNVLTQAATSISGTIMDWVMN